MRFFRLAYLRVARASPRPRPRSANWPNHCPGSELQSRTRDCSRLRALSDARAGLAGMQHRPYRASVHCRIALAFGERTQVPPGRPPPQRSPRWLTPPGVLPPFISDDNDILVSGENEVEALVAVAGKLSASPLVFLYPSVPALGSSHMSYRQLAGPSFRLTPFQGLFAPEKHLRLETVLGAVSSKTPTNLRQQPRNASRYPFLKA